MEPLDRIAETIAAHHVNFVVIGNYGAQLHGVEVQTQDADMAFLERTTKPGKTDGRPRWFAGRGSPSGQGSSR